MLGSAAVVAVASAAAVRIRVGVWVRRIGVGAIEVMNLYEN